MRRSATGAVVDVCASTSKAPWLSSRSEQAREAVAAVDLGGGMGGVVWYGMDRLRVRMDGPGASRILPKTLLCVNLVYLQKTCRAGRMGPK